MVGALGFPYFPSPQYFSWAIFAVNRDKDIVRESFSVKFI
jgi:hypothetical protein